VVAPEVRRLGPQDLPLLRQLNVLFGEVFDDRESYLENPPDDDYCRSLLADSNVILIAAIADGRVVGGLGGYRLRKFERARSEIYIYDLAVAEDMRRQGIATALIEAVRQIARETDCWMIFVQGDQEDEPAIALYRKLGVSEEQPLHFDIAP
jgi:aminoglycoside 3-N-acetyltransferase I